MKKLSLQKGFTLVEMIVSLAIFTIVALVAVEALLKITDANRKAITLKTAINNLNFALESMSREVRVGSDYYLTDDANATLPTELSDTITSQRYSTSDLNPGAWLIAFNSSKTAPIAGGGTCQLIYAYRFIPNPDDTTRNTIQKAQQDQCGDQIGTGNSTFQPLISSDINITDTIVSLDASAKPKIFIWLKGDSGFRETEKTQFSIQTSISYGK